MSGPKRGRFTGKLAYYVKTKSNSYTSPVVMKPRLCQTSVCSLGGDTPDAYDIFGGETSWNLLEDPDGNNHNIKMYFREIGCELGGTGEEF
jgi:hypothetical protein